MLEAAVLICGGGGGLSWSTVSTAHSVPREEEMLAVSKPYEVVQ